MIRLSLRAIGVGCIVAGGILYFTPLPESTAEQDTNKLEATIASLEEELKQTKEELAIAQTTSSVDTNEATEQEEVNVMQSKTITIERGVKSSDVAATLERMGVIDNSKAFDDYLKDHQLANKIQIGVVEVDPFMSFEELATKLTTVD